MARYEDMLDAVRGSAYGAPDDILLRALVRATQELCKQTQCWRETLDETYAQAGIGTYEFLAPFETVVDRILWVKVGGQPVCTQARPEDVLSRAPAEGFPRLFAQDSITQEVHLWPTPGRSEHEQVISIHAALSPTLRSSELPDGLVDEYQQGIVAAAKADLLLNSPDMPWHNPQTGMAQRVLADHWFGRAKRAQHSGHGMLLTVAPRRFI